MKVIREAIETYKQEQYNKNNFTNLPIESISIF